MKNHHAFDYGPSITAKKLKQLTARGWSPELGEDLEINTLRHPSGASVRYGPSWVHSYNVWCVYRPDETTADVQQNAAFGEHTSAIKACDALEQAIVHETPTQMLVRDHWGLLRRWPKKTAGGAS